MCFTRDGDVTQSCLFYLFISHKLFFSLLVEAKFYCKLNVMFTSGAGTRVISIFLKNSVAVSEYQSNTLNSVSLYNHQPLQ